VVTRSAARARAYAYCERLARGHYENFPVASLLLPAAMRPHVAAVYAFARRADDFADEPGLARAERLRLLDGWLASLRRAAGSDADAADAPDGDALIFEALGDTIRRHSLPLQPFEDLLSAFRQDVTTSRYGSWVELLDYCRRSANPVGRLVLGIGGYSGAGLEAASDAVCTALQLTNFWQDLGRDWDNGRLYVPREDLERTGASEADLAARQMTPEWRAALALMAHRTASLFEAGRAVCDGVEGRLRWELRATWLGGRRILEKVEAVRRSSFDQRPTLGVADLPGILWHTVAWSR
jgi:squalene synthase HpnC